MSDDELKQLRRGGHDYHKLYAAYTAAGTAGTHGHPRQDGQGLDAGRDAEARNVTHQQKKLNEEELRKFRDRLELPIPDDQLKDAPYYHPGPDAPR